MLRIGEVAKMFDVSNRTLRYWEDKGILKSTRAENDYRFYDDKNITRVKQIIFFRKLRMPISDIERVFVSDDYDVAIDALINHLQNLKGEVFVLDKLTLLIEKLIKHMRAEKSMTRILAYIENNSNSTFSEVEDALQILLSERDINMLANQLNDVRIIRIPGMTVASYRAESETPEKDCADVMNKFILKNSLNKKSGFRHFGFNNPCPTENSPVYGYEIWVAIPEDFEVPDPLVKKQYDGGLYASITTKMGEIGERWQQLHSWVTNSDKYGADFSFQWLEECIDFETFIIGDESIQQLDLLEPINLKNK